MINNVREILSVGNCLQQPCFMASCNFQLIIIYDALNSCKIQREESLILVNPMLCIIWRRSIFEWKLNQLAAHRERDGEKTCTYQLLIRSVIWGFDDSHTGRYFGTDHRTDDDYAVFYRQMCYCYCCCSVVMGSTALMAADWESLDSCCCRHRHHFVYCSFWIWRNEKPKST